MRGWVSGRNWMAVVSRLWAVSRGEKEAHLAQREISDLATDLSLYHIIPVSQHFIAYHRTMAVERYNEDIGCGFFVVTFAVVAFQEWLSLNNVPLMMFPISKMTQCVPEEL